MKKLFILVLLVFLVGCNKESIITNSDSNTYSKNLESTNSTCPTECEFPTYDFCIYPKDIYGNSLGQKEGRLEIRGTTDCNNELYFCNPDLGDRTVFNGYFPAGTYLIRVCTDLGNGEKTIVLPAPNGQNGDIYCSTNGPLCR